MILYCQLLGICPISSCLRASQTNRRTDVQFTHIEAVLSQGCKLHAFLSGGGLRVVRIEDGTGELKGYGEHPHVEDALAHANLDSGRGHRPYSEVYGKEFPHYLTGNTNPTSPLDAWIRKGNTFDVTKDGDEYVFDLVGYQHFEVPEQVKEDIDKGSGCIEWEDSRGFRYRSEPSRFPNGQPTISTSIISEPPDSGSVDGFMWRIKKTGRAATFWDALEAAWEASPMELEKD